MMIEKLKNWGCNTEDALERMLDDEEFYADCLREVLSDPCFEKLGEALQTHQIAPAFEAAHTLKGVLANLGLTPMYNTVVSIVEPLRAGRDANLMGYYRELMNQKDYLQKLMG